MTPNFCLDDCYLGTVTVGERGQVVIPAEARKKLEIGTGDRLFLMSHPTGDGLMILKIEAMREFLNHLVEGLSMVDTLNTEGGNTGRESNGTADQE